MGLDIVAHSRLRFVSAHRDDEADDEEDTEDLVSVYAHEFDRRGRLAPGLYAPRTLADVWWAAEHSGAELPDGERERTDAHVAAVLAERQAHCPGDAAVLADDPPVSASHSFRAGSYSGYNRWREALCEFALGCAPDEVWSDAEAFEGRPFFELINFSDAEGCIGPEAAQKLARDFAQHAQRAKAVAIDGFFSLYREWQVAFNLAAKEGVVIFC